MNLDQAIETLRQQCVSASDTDSVIKFLEELKAGRLDGRDVQIVYVIPLPVPCCRICKVTD